MRNQKKFTGFSLIEMLVVITIFVVVSVLATQSLANSLRGAKKSSNIGRVKTNLEYTLSTMERLLRNAQEITCTSSIQLDYRDENGVAASFTCIPGAGAGHIASGSANLGLSAANIDINANCATQVFTCNPGGPNTPPSVEVNLVGEDMTTAGAETAQATARTEILLRTY